MEEDEQGRPVAGQPLDLSDLLGQPRGIDGEGDETDEPDDEEDEFKEDLHVENDFVAD